MPEIFGLESVMHWHETAGVFVQTETLAGSAPLRACGPGGGLAGAGDARRWQVAEVTLRLFGWSAQRRVVLDRCLQGAVSAAQAGTFWDECRHEYAASVTRHHAHHYFGFAETQWKRFMKENPRRVKPLLYVYRVLLTGIWLMRTGEIEANLVTLNEAFRLPHIPDLVARKLGGPEQSALADADMAFHEREYERLQGELQTAQGASL